MKRYSPMLAEATDTPFNGSDWLFEVKWDGIRAIAYVDDALSLRSRNDKELSQNFPELGELSNLTSYVVLDGEIIVMRDGKPNFQSVVKRVQASNLRDVSKEALEMPATYIVFDILERAGSPVIERPLVNRKSIIKDVLKEGKHVIISSYVKEQGEAYYLAAISKGLEGIIAKRLSSPYRPGIRSKDWLKVKRVLTIDCVVIGYTQGEGTRSTTFGALLLGLYKGEQLVYIGRVGTGFNDKMLNEIMKEMSALSTSEPQVSARDIPQKHGWLKPHLVAEVGYQELTDDGRLRAPRFLRLRNDKAPTDCMIDQVRKTSLEEYQIKRDFAISPEPSGGESSPEGDTYVIQEHHARRLHWDLRLEKDGVLKSWAVPKQPPEVSGERRLAVMVEDHPLEYRMFEGVIPEGEYGAGTVKIWDKGTYKPLKWTEDKIEFMLRGERLKGQYELIRFKKAGENQWLLFKKKEE